MREIRFRAWHTVEKCFWHFDLVTVRTSTLIDRDWFRLDPAQQYTGLKDKNGKEIYEGDIVQYILDNPDNLAQTFIEEVSYQGSGFCVDGQCPVDATTDWEVEVIGNIYETPELLKP